MRVGILSVGTELLMGHTINTNAAYLGKKLNDYGHSVLYQFAIGDNPERLAETFRYLLSKCDLVMTTGGLGPTQDDLTKEVVTEALGLELVYDQSIMDDLEEKFSLYKKVMSENNKKQALKPYGSKTLTNQRGTAPGLLIEVGQKNVILLPGPPREMQHVFEKNITRWLVSKSEFQLFSKYINLFGIGESTAAEKIDDLVSEQSNPTIAIYAKIGQVSIRVTAAGQTEKEAEVLAQPTIDEIVNRLKEYVVTYDEVDLVDSVVEKLLADEISISFAESCTGGLLVKTLTDYSGISQILNESYITYSNKSKEKLLGVSQNTLINHGAVSGETAYEMVKGLQEKTASDLCVSVTGIAGPNGGTEAKPVGLVYVGIYYKGNIKTLKFHFGGDREKVRIQTTLNVYNEINKII